MDHTFTAFLSNGELLQCMLNFFEIEMHEPCLLDYGYIAAAQQTDHLLMAKLDHDPLHFQWLTVALPLCLMYMLLSQELIQKFASLMPY